MERNNEVIHWTKYVEKQRERTMCSVPVCNRGQEGRDIYNTMDFKEKEVDKIEALFSKFDEYCEPRKK